MRRYWPGVCSAAAVGSVLGALRDQWLPWLARAADMTPINAFLLVVGLIFALVALYLHRRNTRKIAEAISVEICDLIDYRSATDPERQKVEVLTRLEGETGLTLIVFQRRPRVVNALPSPVEPPKETENAGH